MATVEEARRKNLQALRQECGSVQGLADKLGRSVSQVSQWLNASVDPKSGKPRNISTRSARMIEKALRLPECWLDSPHDPVALPRDPAPSDRMLATITREEMEMLALIRRLDADGKATLSSVGRALDKQTDDNGNTGTH
jgi:transcriptional regulator with XRE-family HTH domain